MVEPVCEAFECWPVVRIVVPALKHQVVPGKVQIVIKHKRVFKEMLFREEQEVHVHVLLL